MINIFKPRWPNTDAEERIFVALNSLIATFLPGARNETFIRPKLWKGTGCIVRPVFVQPILVQSFSSNHIRFSQVRLGQVRLGQVRIGLNGLDENRLDESRWDQNELDEKQVYRYFWCLKPSCLMLWLLNRYSPCCAYSI